MKLNKTNFQIQLKKGLEANINATATKALAVEGELHYATDTETLYLFNGTENKQAGMRFTSTDADPTTTEIPEGGFGIHKNTDSGAVVLAFNDGGVIKTVALV